jgi:hypothetical protein
LVKKGAARLLFLLAFSMIESCGKIRDLSASVSQAFGYQSMRRFGLYAALALCVCGLPATAADQYGQWSLEQLHSNVVTLTYTQSIPRDDNDVRTAELGFICIQKDDSRTTFGATLLPSEGGYENAQDEVTVLIHKGERYGSSDLSQKWQNSRDYLFLDSQDEIGALVGYLKTNEADGEKFVYLFLFRRPFRAT